MKKIRLVIASIVVMAGVLAAALPTLPVQAINVFEQCKDNADASVCKSQGDNAESIMGTVIDLMLYTLGIISVIMIVVGGIRFATADGDPSGIKSARNTVIYSVVGLIVAILSFAIVNFVLGEF